MLWFFSVKYVINSGVQPFDSSKHHDDQKSNCCNKLSYLNRPAHNGMKVSIMSLKTAIAHIGWVAVSIWMSFASSPSMYCFLIFAHQSPCQKCHDSVAGPDVGRSAAGVEFLFNHSNFVVPHLETKARKPRTTSLYTAKNRIHIYDIMHLPKDPNCLQIFMMRRTCPWHYLVSSAKYVSWNQNKFQRANKETFSLAIFLRKCINTCAVYLIQVLHAILCDLALMHSVIKICYQSCQRRVSYNNLS